jgi:hypothetical protein
VSHPVQHFKSHLPSKVKQVFEYIKNSHNNKAKKSFSQIEPTKIKEVGSILVIQHDASYGNQMEESFLGNFLFAFVTTQMKRVFWKTLATSEILL